MKNVTDENRLTLRCPQLIAEWDTERNAPLKPVDVSYASNKYVWWLCSKCHYSWRAKVSNRGVLNRGCPCCASKKLVAGINDLATRNPELAKEWHPTKNGELTPSMVMLGTARKVWWLCPKGHSYLASVLHRGHGTNCPKCNSRRQTSFAEKAIFYYIKQVLPDAIHRDATTLGNRMELDIYIPSVRLAIEYDGAYWHRSSKAKSRETKKFERCKELGIKLIRIKETQPSNELGAADLTLFADDTGHNKTLQDIIVHLLEKIDPKQSHWTRKTAYPIPSVSVDIERDRFKIIGALHEGEKWSNKYPHLQEEWNTKKNEGMTLDMFSPGSDEKVWWKCSTCGHEWETSIGHRAGGTGCPQCCRKNNQGKNHYLARKIYQYDKNGVLVKEWDCISDASRELSINSSNITMCAKGIRNSAGGFVWKYEEE